MPVAASSQPYMHPLDTTDEPFNDLNLPEITLVKERSRFGEVLTPTISDEIELQMAFSNFESAANQLPGPYNVSGCKLFEEGRVYRIEISRQCDGDGFDFNATSTLIDIRLDEDGSPHWTTDGPSLESDFKMRLDRLIERTIDDSQLT